MTGRGGCRSERACGGGSLRSAAPGRLVAELGAASAAELLEAAARRLNRPCTRVERHGRAEREVVAAAEGADLLIVARDGDSVRLGPKSLGPASALSSTTHCAPFGWHGRRAPPEPRQPNG